MNTLPNLQHIPVFQAGEQGCHAYRIPAIQTAGDGTLLAFAEARWNNLADPGGPGQTIDLVMKRSRDGGRTWSEIQCIEAPGEFWSAANPATLYDRDTATLWLFYLRCRPGAGSAAARPGTDDIRLLARTSRDHGRTWSQPRDLTPVARDLTDPRWKCTVPGPGGAIQTRSGRLLLPCWKLEPWGNFVLFSDDHGESWSRSPSVPGQEHTGGNECQLVELNDGRILLDIRQMKGPHRWFAESQDEGGTWSPPRPGLEVVPVACAITRLPARPAPATQSPILWTGPIGPNRSNLGLRISMDNAKTFAPPLRIRESMAAYSDLTPLPGGGLGVLWEHGIESPYETLAFTRIPENALPMPG